MIAERLASAVELDTGAAQAACVAEWKGNDRARAIRLILGELTLHLSALFAWVIPAAVGLLTLPGLAVPVLVLGFLAWLARPAGRAVGAVYGVIEPLLYLLRATGVMIVHVLRWLGLPPPPPDAAPAIMPSAVARAGDAPLAGSADRPDESSALSQGTTNGE